VRQALDDWSMREEIRRLNRVTQIQNTALQEMNASLERKVEERTHELHRKNLELRKAFLSTVRALSEAVDAKDPYTRGHSERVGVYASRIARELGCKHDFLERIYLAGLLHDIGKIGIPDAIIGKPDRLTPEEYAVMKRHPEIGARILEAVDFLSDIVPCVRHHHEWYDGSTRGYPDRLTGGEIPFPSRIILVADTVEAMTSDRPYRKALPLERVVEEIQTFRGTQFDPDAADAFIRIAEREEASFIETASKFDIASFVAGDWELR
jgi:putative nucleotidyltransferase with HDIG domain